MNFCTFWRVQNFFNSERFWIKALYSCFNHIMVLFVFCSCLDDICPLYQVVVNKGFLGGLALRCSGNKVYHLPRHCLIYLSHGQRVNKSRYHPRRYQSLSSIKSQSSYSYNNRDRTTSFSRQVRSCEHYKHKAQDDNKKVGTKVAKGKEGSHSPWNSPIRANKTQAPVGDKRSTLREDIWMVLKSRWLFRGSRKRVSVHVQRVIHWRVFVRTKYHN